MKLYGEKKIEEVFKEIDEHLEDKTEAYLLGGGAMIQHDFKTATKDIDLVLDKQEYLTTLTSTLKKIGYETVPELESSYEKMKAKKVLERENSPRFDIFLEIVCKKLVLSEGIKKRSSNFIDLDKLTIKILSKEDIFLFKIVATRERDMEDASRLVESGLDWSVIVNETDEQSDHTERKWFPLLYQSIEELEQEYSQECPVKDEIYQRAMKDLEDVNLPS
ncbi:MAG: hypothetical protein KGY66_06695 [Candidatus Thermoplasmatota archaeon]|nr:hypothetical protein [Candidatus Thermoplasmatota archaeon]MBS3790587.1 hypothetical protein [Candidatus Thermoplasmatota archaeon]